MGKELSTSRVIVDEVAGEDTARNEADVLAEFLPVDAQIAHFLSGSTTGRALLEALYDPVLEEPVPERLTDMVRRHRRS